jgi:hypothetical protein
MLGEIRQHGFEDGGVHGSRRVVIKIDAHGDALKKPEYRALKTGSRAQAAAIARDSLLLGQVQKCRD